MMLINASRGSFIVLGLILLVLYSKKIFNNPLYIISFVVITTLLIVIPNLDFFDNFLIINRFNDTSNQDGRLLQIEASLLQFTTSPFTGHGYMNATGNHYFGITRSNFQYTQILGAGGLLLFIPFIAMLYKFFVHKLKNLLNRKALAFLVFGVVYFCFEQPHIFLSLIVLNVFLISYEDI
jgi:O-antigen ligase